MRQCDRFLVCRKLYAISRYFPAMCHAKLFRGAFVHLSDCGLCGCGGGCARCTSAGATVRCYSLGASVEQGN